jgi:hypothetical protein
MGGVSPAQFISGEVSDDPALSFLTPLFDERDTRFRQSNLDAMLSRGVCPDRSQPRGGRDLALGGQPGDGVGQ